MIGGKGVCNRAPPSTRPAKQQALVIYGDDGDKSAWNKPFFEVTLPVEEDTHNNMMHGSGEKSQNDDGTTGENHDDSITKLTDDLSILKKRFSGGHK